MKNRETIASVIASASVMIGAAYSVWRGLDHSILFYVGGIWCALGIWVDPPPNKNWRELHQAAMERRLVHTVMFKTLFVGAILMFAMGIAIWNTGK